MRKFFLPLILILSAGLAFASDNITFTAGSTSVSLQEGNREVSLSGNAAVTTGSLTIQADSITLSGDNYESISCSGSILITDSDQGLSIRTSSLFYDRTSERLLISSWCEISDTANELVASASSLYYDRNAELIELEMNVELVKNTSDGILSASAQRVTFDRAGSTLALSGAAGVSWKDDDYQASVITIDLEEEKITLSGQIGGTVHG